MRFHVPRVRGDGIGFEGADYGCGGEIGAGLAGICGDALVFEGPGAADVALGAAVGGNARCSSGEEGEEGAELHD